MSDGSAVRDVLLGRTVRNRCTAVVLTTPDGRVLLQQRDDNPAIDFPGFWSLWGGYPEAIETPLEGMWRELTEEVVLADGTRPRFVYVGYLGANERDGLDRTEYLFHVALMAPPDAVRTTEGKGTGIFTLADCLALERMAPHHKQYMLDYGQELIASISKQYVLRKDKIRIMSEQQRVTDYFEVSDFSPVKDLQGLESGRGSIEIEGDLMSALIPPEAPAQFVAYLEFPADKPKGYHYHDRKVEYMLVLKGRLRAKFELRGRPDETEEIVLEPGQMVRILPGCIHTLTAIGEKVVAIEYSPQKYSSEDVTKLPKRDS